MKVIVEIQKTGDYHDQIWEAHHLLSKGQLHAFSPSYAAQLIEQGRATFSDYYNDRELDNAAFAKKQ